MFVGRIPSHFSAWGFAWGGLAWFCDTVVYLLKNLVIALHFTLNSKGIEGWTGKHLVLRPWFSKKIIFPLRMPK